MIIVKVSRATVYLTSGVWCDVLINPQLKTWRKEAKALVRETGETKHSQPDSQIRKLFWHTI